MLHRKLFHALAFFSLPQEREYGHEYDPWMLSTNAYPAFTFRVCMLYGNSDRSISSYSVHCACICCWDDGTGQNMVPPPQHPTGSWLLPLSYSSLRLLFLYCISDRVSRELLVPGQQLDLPFQPSHHLSLSFLSTFHSVLLAFQHKVLTRISFKWSLNSLHSPLSGLWGKEWIDQNEKLMLVICWS